MEAIGILGGSFNPIHLGHLAIAELACTSLKLDRVLFVPAWQNPHKNSSPVDSEHRLAMVEKAISDNEKFLVWDGELKRQGLSYTIDTVREIQTAYPYSKLFLLIGADNVATFHQWFQYEEILKRVTLAVTARPKNHIQFHSDIPEVPHFQFPSPEWGVSSTMIRDYLKKGRTCRYLLPEAVRHYINKHKLYM